MPRDGVIHRLFGRPTRFAVSARSVTGMESTRREIIERLKDLTQPTGQEEQLEVNYPDARVHIPVKQALAVAGVIVVVIAVWVFIGSRGSSADFVASGDFSAVAAVPAEEPAGELVVSVVGAVTEPGLLTLPAGARVADALAQVQTLPEADLVALNQAQLLVDGQQVVVPAVGPTGPSVAGGGEGGGKVSLNSADATELSTLNGVGEATAAAIIAHRESIGGFTALEQLLDVKGIGPAKYEKISGDISL